MYIITHVFNKQFSGSTTGIETKYTAIKPSKHIYIFE